MIVPTYKAIDDIYIFTSIHKGHEGIMAYILKDKWTPLVATSTNGIEPMVIIAQAMEIGLDSPYKLRHFVPGIPCDITDQFK